MITIKHQRNGLDPVEVYGLSSDEKPTDVCNASVFYEMDTKKMFMFDEKNQQWLEQ